MQAEETTSVEPTVDSEAPAVDTTTTNEENPQDVANEVLNTLRELNVETPQELQNLATASQQAGHLANQLGEERRQRQELQQMVNQMQQQQQQATQQQQQPTDYYTDTSAQPQGMTSTDVKSAIRDVLQNEFIRPQQEANAKYFADENRIASDQDYALVKPAWEQMKESPAVKQRMMSGQTNMWDEYNNVKMSWYRGLAKKSQTALELVMGSEGAGATPPHMESGDANSVPRPTEDNDMKELRRKITDPNKGYTGSTEELDALVRTFIPGAST